MKISHILIILFSVFQLQSCTTIVDATTSEPIEPDPNQRSLGTYIDDKRLQVVIGVNIRKADDRFRDAHFEVTSFNGVVLLTGQVPTADMRLTAAQIASDVPNVRQVHNELQVQDNTAFSRRSADSWLATKVRATLLADSEVKSLRIRTVVENGTVFLMGLVSQTEGNRAASLVSNISGVKEVVRVFEFTDGG